MRFHFQLDGVLRARRLFERQSREHLEQALLHMHRLEQRLVAANQWAQDSMRLPIKNADVPAAELQYIHSVICQARKAIAVCEQQKRAQDLIVARMREAYLRSRGEMETVETLRQQALRQFNIEQARREQSALDEAYLGKLVHSRNASPLPSDTILESDR